MNAYTPAVAIVLAVACAAAPAARAESVWYLQADDTPRAELGNSPPVIDPLPNHAPERDSLPGLLVGRGGAGIAETDPALFQQWATAPGNGALDGPTAVEFWAAMREFGTGLRGVVEAYLLDCDAGGADCTEIAHGKRDILDWSGGWGSWSRHRIGFGRVSHAVQPDRTLALRLVVGSESDDDMIFAYGAAGFPSRLSDAVSDDIAVDCDFGDWGDGSGNEYVVHDEGGPDDWSSPARLDVTVFAASSNLVDAVHVLMGLDDDPVNGGVVATLIDTDIDNNANFALVASVDETQTVIELYACDDTMTDGCDGAVLRRTYPASQHCTAPAAGPWSTDTLFETVLPFGDVGVSGGPLVLTSLVSYAASSLLNSPKDAVLGIDGQDYQAGIYYDISSGFSRLTTGVGTAFVVRRSTNPAWVRTADPLAIVATAPFDDLQGVLDDGQDYYYVVEKEGQVPAPLSAHPNTRDGVVRLGFDDHDPLTAPADAVVSTVQAGPDGLPADGTTTAKVTVVPRDAHGVPVGAGCAIQLDPFALAPAEVAGPMVDHHDGSYTFEIVSTTAGTARVDVTVEGIALLTRPEIEFTAP